MELAEELIVEIIAIRQHHERRVLHHRMPHHTGRIEEHRETLTAALRVPDHACETLAWDAAALKFTNADATNVFVTRTYRKGREVAGL